MNEARFEYQTIVTAGLLDLLRPREADAAAEEDAPLSGRASSWRR